MSGTVLYSNGMSGVEGRAATFHPPYSQKHNRKKMPMTGKGTEEMSKQSKYLVPTAIGTPILAEVPPPK